MGYAFQGVQSAYPVLCRLRRRGALRRLQQELSPNATPLKAVSRKQGIRPSARLPSFSLTVFRLAHKCHTTPSAPLHFALCTFKTGICAQRILQLIAHRLSPIAHHYNTICAPRILRRINTSRINASTSYMFVFFYYSCFYIGISDKIYHFFPFDRYGVGCGNL